MGNSIPTVIITKKIKEQSDATSEIFLWMIIKRFSYSNVIKIKTSLGGKDNTEKIINLLESANLIVRDYSCKKIKEKNKEGKKIDGFEYLIRKPPALEE